MKSQILPKCTHHLTLLKIHTHHLLPRRVKTNTISMFIKASEIPQSFMTWLQSPEVDPKRLS